MKKFSEFICKYKIMIIIISLALLIPAAIGMHNTKINYDILVYLPSNIETVKGENILTDDFNMGSFATVVTNKMSAREMLKLENKIKKVDGVEKVVSIYDVTGTFIPLDFVPSDILKKVKNGDKTLLLVTFKYSTSDQKTLDACTKIRKMSDDRVKMGGMSSMVLDTMNLSEKEITTYVIIAVLLCIVVLTLALDSYAVPFILLSNIGIAILYNMGSNMFLGNISYITKAISSVLQLGVTTDFSIFLYHKYEHYKEKYGNINKAMSKAIMETMTSVIGSSLTTVAGFLALCTMNLTLGKDIGIVMAKGVILGVICVLTVFPALLLAFDKLITKTSHKEIIPSFKHLNGFISNHYIIVFIIFLVLLLPAWFGQKNAEVYYNLDKSLPANLESSIANKDLKEKFNIVSPEIILIPKEVKTSSINAMADELKDIKGIDLVLNPNKLSALGLDNVISEDMKSMYQTDNYNLILLNSEYKPATNELNNQITKVNKIIKKYDNDCILAGEGPLMKDLVTISNEDFHNVNYTSLLAIFIILICVLKSISLPVILVFIIEFAIFVNMGIPFYTGEAIPFVSSIVIGTIQLGATIDYTILMTTKYLDERSKGRNKHDSIKNSLDASVNSIFVSGMCFFASTFGVGIYSKLDMISSLCTLISRGALISMLTVITVLPSFLIIFDTLIMKTTKGLKKEGKKMNKVAKNVGIFTLAGLMLLQTSSVNALTKNETVYEHLSSTGKVKSVLVNEHLKNINSKDTIYDKTNLKDITNINGNEKFELNNNVLSFENKGKEIYYSGKTENISPVEVKITYTLNGKEIKLKDLLGKSGKVSIKLRYTNDSYAYQNVNGKSKKIYTPFVVAMNTVIPSEGVSDVGVTNGKVESLGNNNVVVALATPGLSNSLSNSKLDSLNEITITYNVKNFKLHSIYNVVESKFINEDDLKEFDKLDEVYNNSNELSSSSKKLVEGTNKISEGSTKLNEGLKIALEGATKLEQGGSTVDTSLVQIISGLKSGEAALKDEMSTMSTKIASLNELKAGNELAKKSAQKQISDLVVQGTKDQVSSLKPQIPALIQAGKLTTEEATLIQSTLTEDGNALHVASPNFKTVITALKAKSMLQEEQYESLLGAYNQYVGEDKQGIVYLLNSNIYAIDETIKTLQSSASSITTQLGTIDKYLSELQSKGTKEVKNGSSSLRKGLEELYNGSSSLKDGSNELKEGMTRFDNEGISKINELVNGKLKENVESLKAIVRTGNNYDTFTMKNSEDEGNTKFIMTIDNKEKKTNTRKKSTKTVKKSLLDRIKEAL